jgi:Rrf2 family protein
MKISRSAGYGLLAIGYIAQHRGEKIILSDTISKKYDIPLEYLLKIMQQLVRAGVLRSKRGPRGGFSLAKSPNKITMLEIVEAVEGPLTSDLMMTEHAPRDKFCIKTEKVHENATAAAKRVLKSTKLSDLI